MPIGWVRETGISVTRRAVSVRPPPFREQVRALAQSVASNVSGVPLVHRTLVPTVWTRWSTAGDERVCPVCGPYAGRVWPVDAGPRPPLHPGCRCSRAYAYTTWQVRAP